MLVQNFVCYRRSLAALAEVLAEERSPVHTEEAVVVCSPFDPEHSARPEAAMVDRRHSRQLLRLVAPWQLDTISS